MSTSSNILVNIIGEFQKKGFDDANKATKGLQGQFDKLGKKLLAAFSVAAVTKFAKASVKAFEEDQKAATRLTQTLRSMNLAFEDKAVKTFIADVERQSGILDDELRPSMQRLLQTTGSLTKSQELLNLAIEVSRGSGVALETVAQDLSRAYVGQARGLAKYNIGLTAAELKSMSFAEVQERITDQYKGQNAAYLETYSGKVDALGVAYANMQETVGESLVNAFMKLAGDEGIGGATKAIENFGTAVADTIGGATIAFEALGDTIDPINTALENMGINVGNVVDMFQGFGILGVLGSLQQMGEDARLASGFSTSRMSAGQIKAALAARKKAEADAMRRARQLENMQKKSAAEKLKRQREELALKRAGTVFDLENIQIVAAMQGKVSEDQRLRLTALLAINNKNAEAAEKLSLAILATNAAALESIGVTMKAGDTVDDVIKKIIVSQAQLALVALGIENMPKAKNPFEDWTDVIAKILSDLDLMALKLTKMPSVGAGQGVKADPSATVPNPFNPDSPALSVSEITNQIDTLTALRASTASGTAINFLLKEHIDTLESATLLSNMAEGADERTRLLAMGTFNRPGITATSTFDPAAFRKAEEAGRPANINITVNGALDPYAVARQINEVLTLEATTAGSFSAIGTSKAFD